MPNIDVHTYDTWTDFKSNFIHDTFSDDRFHHGEYIFRGQADSDWPLISYFDRWFSNYEFTKNRQEVADLLVSHFIENCPDASLIERMKSDKPYATAIGQHFGLPTRLLDWTDSPYIACYFAFISNLDNLSNLVNPVATQDEHYYVAIHALKLDSSIWDRENGVEVFRPPWIENLRLRNQLGRFTINRTPLKTLEEYVDQFPRNDPLLVKYQIPAFEASDALADLLAMGISGRALFPDLHGAAISAKTDILLQFCEYFHA